MSTLLPIIFVVLFIAAVIELALPIVEAFRLHRRRKPWRKIQEAIDFPPKPGEELAVPAPAYKFHGIDVPCKFVVSRDAEHPAILRYRLEVGDMENYPFSASDVNGGSIIQYLRDKIYAGNY